jgi:hypothetical protein
MREGRRNFVVEVLCDPQAVTGYAASSYDWLVRQARASDLLGRIAYLIEDAGCISELPEGVRAHLESVRLLADAQGEEVRREVAQIVNALAPIGVRPILLKGAAYELAELPPANGRLFSDIDIFVPRHRLDEVERALTDGGWRSAAVSPYDQHYYREWMHELPPMQHSERGTTLDVHHAILPLTARAKPDSFELASAACALNGFDGVAVLSPTDMVLHSMAHLFFNEEFSHGLRDLSDLDMLLRWHAESPGYWGQLAMRAEALGLQRELFFGLYFSRLIFGTPIPHGVQPHTNSASMGGISWYVLRGIYERAFCSLVSDDADFARHAALFAIFIRGHWLRMPPAMLTKHLTRKAWDRFVGRQRAS